MENKIPTYNEVYSKSKIDPLEACYYTLLSKKLWKRCKSDSNRLSKHRDIKTGAVGLAGLIILDRFLEYYFPKQYIRELLEQNHPEFTLNKISIGVKTRILEPFINQQKQYDRTLSISGFSMMISLPELEVHKDLYICCGYNPDIREGYAIGWITAEEIEQFNINKTLKYPAKCIPLAKLHPMEYLQQYIQDKTSVE
jgi:hypothetical protein